jgi:hypothetical protein
MRGWIGVLWAAGSAPSWAQGAPQDATSTPAVPETAEVAPPAAAAPVEPSAPVEAVQPVEPPPSAAPAEPAKPATERPKPVVEARFGKGLIVRSADGDYSLQIRGRIQAQASVLTSPEPDTPPDVNFAIRRMRLTFRGALEPQNLEFYVQLGFAPRDMEPDLLIPLRDAFVTWTGARDAHITFGQKKVPFNRERVISSSSLQLVDRSITNAEFTLDRDIGVQVSSDDLGGLGGRLGYQLGVFAGDGRLRVQEGPGLLYVARIQVQPTGAFADQLVEADLARDPKARLSIGAGVAYNHQAHRQRSTLGDFWTLGTFNHLHAEADVHVKCAGFSFLGEAILRTTIGERERTAEVDGAVVVETARDGVGVTAQAGYLFPGPAVELAARYADVLPLGDVTSLTRKRELTAGLSWYVLGHDLKVQADYGWLTGDVFREGQHQVRLQTQVAF